MDKTTQKEVLIDGKPVTSETEFTPKDSNGSVEVIFTFDGSTLAGHDVVVFEKLFSLEGETALEIASHEDLDDKGQTIKLTEVPKDTPEPSKPVKTGDETTILPSAYHNGIEAIEALSSKKYDLMLLDLMLPDLPGEKILFHLKKHNNSIPVIVISAKNQPEIRINLLRSGADDYITKPFYHEEVLARIESVLRRCSESPQTEYSFKDIRINVDDHKVLVNNTELTLTTTEYNLLQLLIKHPKQTFTKESLYQLIWGKDYISDDNTLNVHISKLRKKLEHIGNQAPYIDTVWGIGYKLHR